jgi:glycosyltransferase involved in cell wall biosynthesis
MGILGQKSPHVVKKISLVGKEGVVTTSNKSVLDLVSEFRASYPSIELILKKDLGHQEAIQYVQATGGILVMPSLLDNSPFTAIEAMVYKMPFLAAKTGGIPEIVGNDAVLFEPNPLALVEKVISIEQIPFESMEYAYSHSKSNNECIDFHHELMEKPKSSKSVFPKHSKVSICIPHRNMTVYLSELLVSIGETTYPNYEVICIDDGSDIPREKSEFQRLKSQYAGSRWTFKTIEHGGAPKARNTAASIASGEFLIFVDSDNIIMPEMATTMVRAMHVSEADCLTCYFRAFSSFNGYDTEKPLYQFAPIGPCQELSYLYNVIGDTNFIIKKQVFDSMGGFPEDSMRWEDWEFLAHLMLAGYKLDVIPEPLLQYRHTEEGVSQRKQTNYYDDYRRILRPWEERFPGYICNSLFSMIAEENKRALIASQENSQIYSFKWFFSALSDLTYDYLHNSRFKFTIPIFRIPSRVVRKLIGLQ